MKVRANLKNANVFFFVCVFFLSGTSLCWSVRPSEFDMDCRNLILWARETRYVFHQLNL